MVIIEFHMVEDSIHLDIDSKKLLLYNCVTCLLWMGIRIFHAFGLFGC